MNGQAVQLPIPSIGTIFVIFHTFTVTDHHGSPSQITERSPPLIVALCRGDIIVGGVGLVVSIVKLADHVALHTGSPDAFCSAYIV